MKYILSMIINLYWQEKKEINAWVAQLVEQWSEDPRVASSILALRARDKL